MMVETSSVRRRVRGFTLIEMLVVIGILGILGAILISQFSGGTASANAVKCASNMRALANAVLSVSGELEYGNHKYMPPAGPYEYVVIGTLKSSQGDRGRPVRQGWISWDNSEQAVSAYTDSDEDATYAITNGLAWRGLKGERSVYTCPAHLKFSTSAGVMPRWSYVMNAYFGWDRNGKKGSNEFGFMRAIDDGPFSFQYEDKKTRRRSADKVLLFAELPGTDCDGRLSAPSFDKSGSKTSDAVLQFKKGRESQYCYGESSGESIGFNHKVGANWIANVAFADGHVAKIRLGRSADSSQIAELTRALCLGVDYTETASGYEIDPNE